MNNTRHNLSKLLSHRKVLENQFYNNSQKRCFIASRYLLQSETYEEKNNNKNNTFKPNPFQFPWLLSNSPPRIKNYPYIKAPSDWDF
ncbi:unnamed protein product [Cunninghamella echinulata]